MMKGKVVQRNYVLNDAAAMKKKLKNEMTRKEPYDMGADAKDGSNVVLFLKTSLFEYVKSQMMQDMLKKVDVKKIDNAVGVKVKSANSGDGFIEFALDITFEVDKSMYTVKFTAYATTCKIMIQPIGEKPKSLESLNQKPVPRYFVDTFLLPWFEAAVKNKKYDEIELIEALKAEVIRMDLLKVDTRKVSNSRTRLASAPAPNVKCAARTCKFSGLNLNTNWLLEFVQNVDILNILSVQEQSKRTGKGF